MNDLETIRKACIEANPEIVALNWGCKIKKGDGELIVTYVSDICQDTMVYAVGFDGHPIVLYTGTYSLYLDQIDEIIGRDIRLADVLLAIGTIEKDGWCIAPDGQFVEYDVETGNMRLSRFWWNLKDDNLEHHTPETHKFIADIIRNNKK